MNANMANRDVADLTFVDYSSKVPFLTVDYANVTGYDLTGETVYAYGGHGHPQRVGFSGERGGTLTIETQITPFKLYSMVTGANIENSAKFLKREELPVSSKSVTLSTTPSGEVSIFDIDDDCGTPIEHSGSGATITLSDSGTHTKVIAYYLYDITSNVKKLNIKGSTFPKSFAVYGETTYKTEDDEEVAMKFIAYKCMPQSTLSVSMSNTGDPATLTITCDLMVDGDNNLMDLIEITE